MAAGFDRETLDLLRDIEEVEIETRAGPGAAIHRAIIWVVVDGEDRVLIRTYLGPDSRWYREATAYPDVVIVAGDRTLGARAETAADRERTASYDRVLVRKYAGHRSTQAMLAGDLVPTTLELTPR